MILVPGSQSGGGSPVEFRPPKPGFLPPAPPPFSASPVPPVLSSVGLSGAMLLTYDSFHKPEHVHEQQLSQQQQQQLTPPSTPATITTTETNGSYTHNADATATATSNGLSTHVMSPTTGSETTNVETRSADVDHPTGVDLAEVSEKCDSENGQHHENAESSEYEYYDDSEDDEDEKEAAADVYEKVADQQLLVVEEEEVSEVVRIYVKPNDDVETLDAAEALVGSGVNDADEGDEDDEYEYYDDDEDESVESSSTTSSDDEQCHVQIEEVVADDHEACKGLEVTNNYDITEVEGDESEDEAVNQEGLIEDGDLIKESHLSQVDVNALRARKYSKMDDDEGQDVQRLDEQQLEDDPKLEEQVEVADPENVAESTHVPQAEQKLVQESGNTSTEVEKPKPEMSRENQLLLLRFPVSPQIPPFVESIEPCKFHDDPTRWIEWLEAEVKMYRERKEEEKRKKEKEMQEQRERDEQERKEKERLEREKRDHEERVKKEQETKEENERLEKENREKEEMERLEKEKIERDDELEGLTEENKVVEIDFAKDEKTVKDGMPGNKKHEEDWDEGEWEWENESDLEAGGGQDIKDHNEESKQLVDTLKSEPEIQDKAGDELEKEQVSMKDDDSGKDLDFQATGAAPEVAFESGVIETPEVKAKPEEAEAQAMKIEPEAAENHSEEVYRQRDSHEENDPMEVLERIKKIKQSKAYKERHSFTEEPTSGGLPFMRQMSNPEHGGRRSRPASLVGDNGLDDMLQRIKKLREERLQILQDMSMMRSAFDQDEEAKPEESATTPMSNTESTITPTTDNSSYQESTSITGVSTPTSWDDQDQVSRSRVDSLDSGIGGSAGFSIRKKSKRRLPWEEADSTEHIMCYICGQTLGRLNKASSVHMGLEDGEPICSDAIHLTERSRRKIRNIAYAKKLDLRTKYELCETLDLDFIVEDSQDISAQEVLDRVEHFLDDIELQKERDREEFEAMRAGAIDAILAAEFANHSSLDSNDFEEQLDQQQHNHEEPVEREQLEVAEPEVDETGNGDESHDDDAFDKQDSDDTLQEARAQLLKSIQGGKKLKRANTNDKSEPAEAGKVLHKHIAPRAFTRSHRQLMKSIEGKVDQAKLHKVTVNDRSAPYIPKDIEIYFYSSGPNVDKKATTTLLPPVSKQAPVGDGYDRY